MTQEEKIKADLRMFQLTGELPAAWEPEPAEPTRYVDDTEFDRRISELNRELEEIESGCVEPPRFGWLSNLSRYGEP